MFVGLECNTEINLEKEVNERLIKPTTTVENDAKNEWTVTVNKPKKNSKVRTDVKNKVKTSKKEIHKHLENIRNILLHSNATPIKSHTGHGYMCGFCPEHFTIPTDLRIHTIQNHDSKEKSTYMKGYPITYYAVKIDITGLKCELCGQDIDRLETLMDHLQTEHNKTIHRDIKNRILPFKFEGEVLKCVLCPNTYDHFKLLVEHMNVHYNNYNCDICNAPFLSKRTFQSHMARHNQGEFSCTFCSKVFDTTGKKRCHEKFVHINSHKRNKCPHCDQKFASYVQRNKHMVREHGVKPVIFKCMACERTFTTKFKLTRHTKRDHLLERQYECEHCDKKFYGQKQLQSHLLKHTGEKQYKCNVCSKAFGRKFTLREHLRIHADDRRFKCEQCGQTFVQKCSWKSHMWSRHNQRVVYDTQTSVT